MNYRRELNKINSYKPGRPIEEVKRSLKLAEVQKLASNEIPFPPYYITKAIRKEIKNINRYPESGSFYLRKALSGKLGVNRDQIIFGNGSDELIVLTLKALISKGDEVVVAYPTFLIYEIQAKVTGAKVVRVPFEGLKCPLSEIAKKISRKTKIVFIANPDNPTGTYLNQKEVEKFLAKIPKQVLVFFDEAYFEFAPKDFPQTLKFINKRGNVMVIRTFSKVYGLAGLRIGYGVTTRELAGVLNKIREPFNINRFAQVAALAALKNKGFLNKVIAYVKKEKEYLYGELRKCKLSFTESATNFILVDFGSDVSALCNYLLKQGVIVRDLKSWGMKNCFRVTVGLSRENGKFIRHLKSYLKSVRRKR